MDHENCLKSSSESDEISEVNSNDVKDIAIPELLMMIEVRINQLKMITRMMIDMMIVWNTNP